MGWKFVWWLHIERTRDPNAPKSDLPPALLRYAAFGLAVIGVIAIILWRVYH